MATLDAEHESDRWEALANLPEEERIGDLRPLYESVVPLGEMERQAKIEGFIRGEYALPEEKLLAVTRARLLAWLEMEPEAAKTVATSYDLVMRTMPGSIALRRVSAVQTISLGMSMEQIERLFQLIPSVLRQIPRLIRREAEMRPLTMAAPVAGTPRTAKRGLAFWRHG